MHTSGERANLNKCQRPSDENTESRYSALKLTAPAMLATASPTHQEK